MIEKVFLSYAEEDALTARRVYLDLDRSMRVEAWGYKEKGRIAENFKNEFEEQIKGCRYFCLFDSPHARRSSWIRHECGIARATNAIMVVCLLTTDADGSGWRQTELFEGHNLIRGIALTEYASGIRQLFEFLQVVYSPGSMFPRDQDFEREIFSSQLDVNRAQELFNLYREFRERSGDLEFAEAQLQVVISKCQYFGAKNAVSPALALAVMHADAGRHQEALRVFAALTQSHPNDPRGWAGLGGAYFHMGRYEQSVEALQRAHAVALARYKEESTQRVVEIVHNIVSVQILIGRRDAARTTLDGLSNQDQAHPFIRGLRGRLLLRDGYYNEALPHLQEAHAASVDVSAVLIVDLADCYWHLGQFDEEVALLQGAMTQWAGNPEICHRAAESYLRRGSTTQAIAAMRRASEHSRDAPRYRAQLAALLHQAGQTEEARAEAEACVELSAPTAQDRYYRGLAYYVLGKTRIAEDELAASRRDPVVSAWPDYAKTCGHEALQSSGFSRLIRTVFPTAH